MAELLVGGSEGQLGGCTATLIGPQTALTAAHCIDDGEWAGVWGELDFDGTTYPVVAYTLHPLWDPAAPLAGESEAFDLAVLHVDSVVAGIIPVALATRPPDRGQSVQVVGFGVTDDTHRVDDGSIKRVAKMTVSLVGERLLVLSNELFGNACAGDSGGPHLVSERGEEVQVGLTASATPCGDPLARALSPRVDVHREWIEETMEQGIFSAARLAAADSAQQPLACGYEPGRPSMGGPAWLVLAVMMLLAVGRRAIG